MPKKKELAALLLAVGILLSGCSHGHESFMFETGSYQNHLTDKSRLSTEYLPGIPTTTSRRAGEIAVWKVAEIEAQFYYDEDDDHVGFLNLVAYDKYGEEHRIDGDTCCEEVYVEWLEKSDGTKWVDEVFFVGEEGTYIFSMQQEIK